MLDIFLTASRGEFYHQNFVAPVTKRLKKLPREAFCSALSSRVRWALAFILTLATLLKTNRYLYFVEADGADGGESGASGSTSGSGTEPTPAPPAPAGSTPIPIGDAVVSYAFSLIYLYFKSFSCIW